jgi:hypothetical protein
MVMCNNVKLPYTFSTILLFRAALGHNFFKHAVHASKYILTVFFLNSRNKVCESKFVYLFMWLSLYLGSCPPKKKLVSKSFESLFAYSC